MAREKDHENLEALRQKDHTNLEALRQGEEKIWKHCITRNEKIRKSWDLDGTGRRSSKWSIETLKITSVEWRSTSCNTHRIVSRENCVSLHEWRVILHELQTTNNVMTHVQLVC